MSLVRWLRRNNTKIMAIVVVGLMIVFVGGSYIQQFARRTGRPTETVAYFGQNGKITHNDILQAQQELEILKMVRSEALLRSQDLRGLLLGELLFPEHRASAELVGQIQELIKANGYRISEKQINDIYRGTMSAGTYWLLLKKETEQAGFIFPKEEAGKVLAMMAPKVFEGASYQQLVASMMRQGISEDDLLSSLGSLLAVLQYARVTCAGENLTSNQIMHEVSREAEKMNVEFVRFDSALFATDVAQPTQQQIEEQFNKYKNFSAGDVNDQNPYGFGYKLPETVQFEYLAVKLDDVARVVPQPSSQDMEDYYQKHIDQFTVSYRSDPNDPNSPVIKKPRSYGEVGGIIARILSHETINTKAEGIIHQLKELVEAKLQSADVDAAKLTSEQFKQLAGDYAGAAAQIGEKNNVKIYTGKTGHLIAMDMQTDAQLREAYVSSFKSNPVPLAKVVFAADDLGVSELGPFDPPKPRLYENIGPVQGMAGKTMMLVRVIEVHKAAVPENLDLTFSSAGLELNSDANKPQEKVYSVRKNVSEDLKKLAAMDIAKSKAEEFIAVAKKDGWDNAVKKFNKLYPQTDTKEPNAFKLQTLTDLQRFSKSIVRTYAAENIGDPMSMAIIHQTRQQYFLLEQLYSLVPPDGSSPPSLPAILEFKPNMSWYCLKDLSVKRINANEYEKLKAKTVFNEDFAQSQAMAAVHYNPDNIVKRMNFRWAKKELLPVLHPEETLPPEGDY